LIFLLPCFALATLPPYLIRAAAMRLTHVGRISGMIIAASTVGSIAGVFVSGYILIDHFGISEILRATGMLIAGLGILCMFLERWFRDKAEESVK
jgi:predicted MFS family arabinose efflux permease